MRTRTALLVVCILGLAAAGAQAQSWWARPIVVHEWGVELFDWGSGGINVARPSDIPSYMYTDAQPGKPVAMPTTRAKDLPPDSGMRMKPVLYFYPNYRGTLNTPIGVEMRFAKGHASAWYPQANVYRPDALAAAGKPADLAAWEAANGVMKKNRTPVPDDTRMQLAWYSLTLSNAIPNGAHLLGDDLPADHWAKVARDVPNAAYVSNGTEAEKYLFYEGKTSEQPDIAVVPGFNGSGRAPQCQIVNISDRPIYDVFAIYHAGGHTWVGFVSSLDPMKSAADSGSGGVTVGSLPVPDFSTPDAPQWTDPKSLRGATTGRLLSALTEGGSFMAAAKQWRNPAEPQGPTTSGQLFPDEAAALEKIWHHDFFEHGATDGLTVLYRQSPAELDDDMPLQLYTDMFHYISLSRCGLVLVSNIDVKLAVQTYSELNIAGVHGTTYDQNARATAMDFLLQHRTLSLSALSYLQRVGDAPNAQLLRSQIEVVP